MKIVLADGRVALVSNEDYAALSAVCWHVSTSGYVVNRNGSKAPVRTTLRMHREVMRLHGVEIPDGQEVDHINHNRLDNRFENLRLCSRSQNLANRPYANRTGFRGVFKRNDQDAYRGIVQWKGHKYNTRNCRTPEEAAQARDELATQLQGEFATLNFSQ